MKWFLLFEFALMSAAFIWSTQIYLTARVSDEQIGAVFPFAIGCLFGFAFLVTLIIKAIID